MSIQQTIGSLMAAGQTLDEVIGLFYSTNAKMDEAAASILFPFDETPQDLIDTMGTLDRLRDETSQAMDLIARCNSDIEEYVERMSTLA